MGEWQIGIYKRSNKAQTFSNLRNNYVPEDLVKGGIEYSCGRLYMYVQGSPVEIQTLSALELDGPQRDCPACMCYHPPYSSVTFVSLHFHSSKE